MGTYIICMGGCQSCKVHERPLRTHHSLILAPFKLQSLRCFGPTSVPGPSRRDGDEDPGKIRFIVPKFWGKNCMRSETQPYSTVIAIRLCRTAHAIFPPKFWDDKTNFTRVFVTVSPRRPWDRGWFRS